MTIEELMRDTVQPLGLHDAYGDIALRHGRYLACDPDYVMRDNDAFHALDDEFRAICARTGHGVVAFRPNGVNYGYLFEVQDSSYSLAGRSSGHVLTSSGMIALIPLEAFAGTSAAAVLEMSDHDLYERNPVDVGYIFPGPAPTAIKYQRVNDRIWGDRFGIAFDCHNRL